MEFGTVKAGKTSNKFGVAKVNKIGRLAKSRSLKLKTKLGRRDSELAALFYSGFGIIDRNRL